MFLPAMIQDTANLFAQNFAGFTFDTTTTFAGNYTVSSGSQENLICNGTVGVKENISDSEFNISG